MSAKRVGSWFEVAPGVDLYYEDEGKGPPIVFVPGWTFTTRVFDHQFAAFSGEHRVISFDPRSHGRSTVTMDGNNYATQGADLAALLAHLEVEDPVLVGWSTGSSALWSLVRSEGAAGIRALVPMDMPPVAMSCDAEDWVEGSIAELGEFLQAIQTASGQRAAVTAYADLVMIEQELTPELTAWVVEQSLATPPIIASNLLADACFANYLEEARQADAEIPQMFILAEHWSGVAKPYLQKHCPNSRVEAFGGHLNFWEYPDRFNALLRDFLSGI